MSNPEFQTSCCASRPCLSSGFVQCSESTAMRVQSGCPAEVCQPSASISGGPSHETRKH